MSVPGRQGPCICSRVLERLFCSPCPLPATHISPASVRTEAERAWRQRGRRQAQAKLVGGQAGHAAVRAPVRGRDARVRMQRRCQRALHPLPEGLEIRKYSIPRPC